MSSVYSPQFCPTCAAMRARKAGDDIILRYGGIGRSLVDVDADRRFDSMYVLSVWDGAKERSYLNLSPSTVELRYM